MKRRTVLQSALGAAGLAALPAWAQAQFPGPREKELREIAAAVLPESLGRKGTDAVADQFTRWVRDYKPGAEMGAGYGVTRIHRKPASPAGTYAAQLQQLSSAVTTGTLAARRQAIAASMKSVGVRDIGNIPDGRHIASDLMTFFFQSPEANDLAYDAAVGKDQCRGIADSAPAPKPRKGGNPRAAL